MPWKGKNPKKILGEIRVLTNFPASFWSPQGSSGRDLGFWVNYIIKGAILVEKHSEKDVSILSKLHPPGSKVVSLRCLHQKSAASKLVSGRDLFNLSLLTGPSKVLKVILLPSISHVSSDFPNMSKTLMHFVRFVISFPRTATGWVLFNYSLPDVCIWEINLDMWYLGLC